MESLRRIAPSGLPTPSTLVRKLGLARFQGAKPYGKEHMYVTVADEIAERAVAFAEMLTALSNPARIALLQQLRVPKALREIEVRPYGGQAAGRTISRQAVREHLDRLLEIGVVTAREGERDYGATTEYVLNHQMLYALSEEFRGLARMRPLAEPAERTVEGASPEAKFKLRGPCLVLVKGLEEGTIFDLPIPAKGRAEWVIGRRRGLDVPLDFDPFVSMENSSVVFEGGQFLLRDLPESRNGTFLNFQPLPKGGSQALATGSIIGVGRSLLVFHG